jgi:prepilin signal peptidase PulO-like enzyme (type II secretory pathway)
LETAGTYFFTGLVIFVIPTFKNMTKSLKIALFGLFLFAAIAVQAQPPKTPATPGTTFGAVITAENATTVAELPTLLGDKEMADVKIEGKVLDVCPKKGCWMSLEMPDKSTVLVKFKDYGFFVPLEMIGKTVVLEGQAKKVETSVDELKHYAEDAKKSKEEIDAITEPKKEIRLTANGVLVVK